MVVWLVSEMAVLKVGLKEQSSADSMVPEKADLMVGPMVDCLDCMKAACSAGC